MEKWTAVEKITFDLIFVDGTRIGGSGGGLEIGGVDPNLTALKDPITKQPYVPGSSLRGKLRCILEREYGLGDNGDPCGCGKRECPVCPVFGAHKNARADQPSRLIVRDAHFTGAYANSWRNHPELEEKTENVINRRGGQAQHPRTQERVPPGAEFASEMILKIFETDGDNTQKWIKELKHALAVLQDFDSLGAGGSRGSGRIRIDKLEEKRIELKDVCLAI